jgi:hypothetical protein
VLFSICLAQLALSFLNPFLEIDLSLSFASNQGLLIFVSLVFIIVSVLSGMYPALVLSGFKPAQALKSQINNRNSSGFMMRKGLVVVQFFISQFFIIGTIVLISQTKYFHSKDMGFRKDAIINIPIPEEENPATDSTNSKMRSLKTEIDRLAGVEQSSLCYTPPASGNVSGTGFILEGETDEKRKNTQVKAADSNYISL